MGRDEQHNEMYGTTEIAAWSFVEVSYEKMFLVFMLHPFCSSGIRSAHGTRDAGIRAGSNQGRCGNEGHADERDARPVFDEP